MWDVCPVSLCHCHLAEHQTAPCTLPHKDGVPPWGEERPHSTIAGAMVDAFPCGATFVTNARGGRNYSHDETQATRKAWGIR